MFMSFSDQRTWQNPYIFSNIWKVPFVPTGNLYLQFGFSESDGVCVKALPAMSKDPLTLSPSAPSASICSFCLCAFSWGCLSKSHYWLCLPHFPSFFLFFLTTVYSFSTRSFKKVIWRTWIWWYLKHFYVMTLVIWILMRCVLTARVLKMCNKAYFVSS